MAKYKSSAVFNQVTEITPNIRPIVIDRDTTACYGETMSSPHPCVYLHVNKDGIVKCPYCLALFVKKNVIEN